jgi:predicted transcriptional regulator
VNVEQVAGYELEAIADKVSEGSMAPFLLHMVSAKKLTRQEASEIRKLLQDYDPSDK